MWWAERRCLIMKEFKDEYLEEIKKENEAYTNILVAIKGVRKEEKLVEIVKKGYDVDLTKHVKNPEKKELKEYKFNKEFCNIEKKGDE